MSALTATNNGEHVDILILDNDIALTAHGCVAYTDGRASIAQDISHMIRETGLLQSLIGQRDREKRAAILVQLVQRIEEDERIVPGTTKITEQDPETYWTQADTVEYNALGFWL